MAEEKKKGGFFGKLFGRKSEDEKRAEEAAERAAQTAELRRVPAESIEELQAAGFFLALQPQRYGGYELDPQDFFRMQLAIAEGCMSTAWASGFSRTSGRARSRAG